MTCTRVIAMGLNLSAEHDVPSADHRLLTAGGKENRSVTE
jgi:hypothetical protein